MRHLRGALLIAWMAALPGCAFDAPPNPVIEDTQLEKQVIARIADERFENTRVNVTAFNHHLLLTGEAPDDDTRTEIANIAASCPGVRGVSNELEIGNAAGLVTSSADNLTSSRVKMQLVRQLSVDTASRIKIVTVSGTVYLMGAVSRKEGETIANIASSTQNVLRVVKIFEYTN